MAKWLVAFIVGYLAGWRTICRLVCGCANSSMPLRNASALGEWLDEQSWRMRNNWTREDDAAWEGGSTSGRLGRIPANVTDSAR